MTYLCRGSVGLGMTTCGCVSPGKRSSPEYFRADSTHTYIKWGLTQILLPCRCSDCRKHFPCSMSYVDICTQTETHKKKKNGKSICVCKTHLFMQYGISMSALQSKNTFKSPTCVFRSLFMKKDQLGPKRSQGVSFCCLSSSSARLFWPVKREQHPGNERPPTAVLHK